MTREIGDIVKAWQKSPRSDFALATLVRARGSSYRQPGARMLISPDGATAGSISGGCLEEEVIERAREVLQSGEPSLICFDTRRRFGCHGEIEVFVEQAGSAFLSDLAKWYMGRACGRILTVFDCSHAGRGSRFLAEGESVTSDALVQTLEPRIRLVVVGKGPECRALLHLGEALDWDLQRFESAAELSAGYDSRTAALIKTHNFGRDFAALRLLLPLGLRYVGLIGPHRRREHLLGDLLDSGIHVTDNLFSPAGHDLGGDSPESIALAIVAEIHAVFAGRLGNQLRNRAGSIHPERRNAAPAKDDSDTVPAAY